MFNPEVIWPGEKTRNKTEIILILHTELSIYTCGLPSQNIKKTCNTIRNYSRVILTTVYQNSVEESGKDMTG